jgi:hypothetical protein
MKVRNAISLRYLRSYIQIAQTPDPSCPTPTSQLHELARTVFSSRYVARINLCVFYAIKFNWTLFITFNFSNLITGRCFIDIYGVFGRVSVVSIYMRNSNKCVSIIVMRTDRFQCDG